MLKGRVIRKTNYTVPIRPICVGIMLSCDVVASHWLAAQTGFSHSMAKYKTKTNKHETPKDELLFCLKTKI